MTGLVLALIVLLAVVGGAAGHAVGRATRSRDITRRTATVVGTLRTALQAAAESDAMDVAAREIAVALRGDACGVGVVDGDLLWLRGLWNMWAGARHRPIRRGEAIAGRVWATARPRVLDELAADPAHIPDTAGMRSGIFVPGSSQGRVVIVIAVESHRPHAFGDDDIRLLSPVADLLAAVTDSRRRLTTAESVEEGLITAVGTELRAPLTTLLGSLSTLQRHAGRLDDAVYDELVVAAGGAGRRMRRLLDSLTLAGRLTAGTVEVAHEAVSVAAVLRSVVDDARTEHPGAAIGVEPAVGTAPATWADPVQLRVVFAELVGNAVSHGDGSPVQVLATVEGGSVVTTIRDSGPGMPSQLVDAARNRFQPTPGDRGGRAPGVGLYLASRLCEAMGGELTIRSRPGHGTAAVVRLPVAETAPVS